MARRGNTLAVTLMVSAMLIVVTMALLGPSVANLAVANGVDNRQIAKNLAESAVEVAIHKLASNPSFGANGETVYADNAVSGTAGIVTFSPNVTFNKMAVPVSTCNTTSNSAVTSSTNRNVPEETLDMVGYGSAGNTTAILEAMVQVRRFPYAAQATGAISTNNTVVGSVNSLASLSGGIIDSALLPADTAAHQDTSVLPSIDMFDTRSQSGYSTDVTSPLSGYYYASGPLTVSGDLQLNGAVLRVDGDLTVNGGITGNGAIYVDGNITFTGASDLQTTTGVALIASGTIKLSGSSTYFTGLLYSSSSISVKNASVVGALVQNGSPGSISLKNTTLVQYPWFSVDFTVGGSPFSATMSSFVRPVAGARTLLWEFN